MKRAFTLVELVVVISVIVILAGITYFSIGNWRQQVAVDEVKSDLINATNALENVHNFSSTYPSSLNKAGFRGSDTVTLSYSIRSVDNSFCLNGSSKEVTSVKWYVDSRQGSAPQEGTCTP